MSNVELKFSDNDELATLIAIGFDAETLLICTSAGGFMDAEKRSFRLFKNRQPHSQFCIHRKSSLGLGGMLSKLTFSNLATSLGIKVIITGLKGAEPFHDALNGNAGTTFIPKQANFKARQNGWQVAPLPLVVYRSIKAQSAP